MFKQTINQEQIYIYKYEKITKNKNHRLKIKRFTNRNTRNHFYVPAEKLFAVLKIKTHAISHIENAFRLIILNQ